MMCRSETPDDGTAHYPAWTRPVLACLGLALALWLAPQGLASEKAPYAATITVNTLADEDDGSCGDGDCSLRDAMQVAVAGDTVNFSVAGTIVLTLGQIVIDKDLTISGPGAANLTVSGNNTSRVFDAKADVSISGLTIANGYTDDSGGGIDVEYGRTLVVTNCTFSGNKADGGGAIVNSGTLEVTNSTFSGNRADLFGGAGIYSEYTATVKTSTFIGNVADDTYGGAIATFGPLDVSKSTFSGNHAVKGGGIYSWDNVYVTESTFSGNEALGLGGGLGGGIYTDDYLHVTNSTFSNNTAMYGGGIYNADDLLLFNCTFSGNSASGSGGAGGGVYNTESGQYSNNTIIANSPLGGNCNYPAMFSQGDTTNLATDDTCGDRFTQITAEALKLNWRGWLFALRPGSAAIDAGSNTRCPATDQRGVARPQDGDGNGSAICDVGSYEVVLMSHRLYLPLVLRNVP